MDDRESDLLTPWLPGGDRPSWTRPPFRLNSQFWLAFFGGPVAVTAIAVLECASPIQAARNGAAQNGGGRFLVLLLELAVAWAVIVGFGLDPDRGARARLLPRWSYSIINCLGSRAGALANPWRPLARVVWRRGVCVHVGTRIYRRTRQRRRPHSALLLVPVGQRPVP